MKRNGAWLLVMLATDLGATACADRGAPLPPETVPAGDVVADALHPVAARYWVEISPRAAAMDLYRIYPGNVIHRDEVNLAVNYNYGGTAPVDPASCTTPPCAPAGGDVSLFTDQNQVTYVDGTNTCYSNGSTFTGDPSCGGKLPVGDVCRNQHTFCGPIQMVSALTFGQTVGAMPNVVLQVAPAEMPSSNAVQGCNDQDPAGAASSAHGLCAFQNATKVDDPTTSNLTSPIPGNGVSNFGCSYCYGNQAAAIAAGKPGLQDVVLSGTNAAMASINTDKVVLVLQNDTDLNLSFTVRYALPALDPAGSQIAYDNAGAPTTCLTRGTSRMTITGGSFGPPGACLTGTPPASCPQSGAPGTGYVLNVPDFATPPAPQVWSDTFLQFTPPANTMTECGVQVSTPLGATATSQPVAICDNQYRSWSPTLGGAPVARMGAMSGVLTTGGQSYVVMTGGRTSVTSLSQLPAAADRTLTMPMPTCASPQPNWTRTTVLAGTQPNVWGAAYAVVNNQLYVVGGTNNGTSCIRNARRMTLNSPTTVTWQNLGSLPDMNGNLAGRPGLCNASLTPVKDANGKTWLVLSGGSTQPVPNLLGSGNTPCQGGAQPALAVTLVMDPSAANPTWTQFSGASQVDSWRFGQGSTQNAAGTTGFVIGGSASSAVPGTTTNRAVTVTVATNGAPTFTNVTGSAGMPGAGLYGPVVRRANNFIYSIGGATALGPAMCTAGAGTSGQLPASTSLLRIADTLTGGWLTTLAPLPVARAEATAAAGIGTDATESKLFVIGGHDGTTAQTSVLEYTP
jgi:hypothetical protein